MPVEVVRCLCVVVSVPSKSRSKGFATFEAFVVFEVDSIASRRRFDESPQPDQQIMVPENLLQVVLQRWVFELGDVVLSLVHRLIVHYAGGLKRFRDDIPLTAIVSEATRKLKLVDESAFDLLGFSPLALSRSKEENLDDITSIHSISTNSPGCRAARRRRWSRKIRTDSASPPYSRKCRRRRRATRDAALTAP